MKRFIAIAVGISILCLPLSAGASSKRQQVATWGKHVYPILVNISTYEVKLGKDIQSTNSANVAGDGLFFYLDGGKLKKYEHAPLPQLSATITNLAQNVTKLGNDLVSYRIRPTAAALSGAVSSETAVNRDINTLATLIKSYAASLG